MLVYVLCLQVVSVLTQAVEKKRRKKRKIRATGGDMATERGCIC